MNKKDHQLFSEADIARMAREIGQPLPGDLKKRIMDKIHSRSKEQSKTPVKEADVPKKKSRDRKRDRGIER